MKNLKQIQFTDQDFQTNLQMVQDLVNALTFQAELTTKEKQRLLKVGDARRSFTNRAMLYGQQYPDLIPNIVNIEDLSKINRLIEHVEVYIRYLRPLLTSLEDFRINALSGSYKESLVIYQNFKALQGLKIEGVKDAFNDLKVLFNTVKTTKEEYVESLEENDSDLDGEPFLVT